MYVHRSIAPIVACVRLKYCHRMARVGRDLKDHLAPTPNGYHEKQPEAGWVGIFFCFICFLTSAQTNPSNQLNDKIYNKPRKHVEGSSKKCMFLRGKGQCVFGFLFLLPLACRGGNVASQNNWVYVRFLPQRALTDRHPSRKKLSVLGLQSCFMGTQRPAPRQQRWL